MLEFFMHSATIRPGSAIRQYLGIAICLTLLFASRIQGQDITGNLYGIVQDQTHAVIPHASLTAVDQERGLTRHATSNDQGEFVLSQLPVGRYKLTVTAPSFETSVRNDIAIDAGRETHLDVGMVPGSVNATVTVDVDNAGVDTRSATIGTLIDNVSLQELPLDGNNIVSLAALLPGVTSVTAPPSFTGDHSGPTFSASGSRVTQNLFLFDGVLYNNLYRNTGLNYPPRDAIQEIQVLTNNYSAEYGRNAGSVFQVVTKSGSNTFHGSVYENAKNTAFNASNYATKTVLPLIQNQFGGTVGGPILKNKFFFEAGYQGFRYITTSTTGSPVFTNSVYLGASRPAQFIDANTNAVIYGAVYDPKTGTQFASTTLNGVSGSVVPYTRFDPTAVAIINAFGLTNANGVYSTTVKLPQSNDLGLIRADYRAGRHSIDFRYYVLDSAATNANGNIFQYGPTSTDAKSMLSSATDTAILSPTMINVFHAGYKRFVTYILPEDPRSLSSFGANFPQIGPGSLPYIVVSSAFTLSSANNIYNQFINQNAELNDSVTWSHGTHTVKAGVSYLYLQFLNRTWNESQGLFYFTGQESIRPGTTSVGSGNPLADFLLGAPSTLTVASPEGESSGIQHEIFAYVQDQWRATRSLTLNFGLRYELPSPWTQQQGRGSTFVYGQQSTKFPNAPTGLVFAGDKGIPAGIVPTDVHNFAPRFGFAWSPLTSGKLSVRGGYGIVFDAINADVMFVSQPYRATYNIASPYSFTDPLRGQPPLPTTLNLQNPTFVGLQSLSFEDANMRSPYVEQTNFGFQLQLPQHLIAELNYVGKFGHKLVLPYTYNPALYAPGATITNQDSRRRIQGFGDLEDFATVGWSNYNGLQAGLTRRMNSLTINTSYTWSRSLDPGSLSNVEGGYLPTPFDLRSNYGPSDFNATQVLSIGYVMHLPALRSHNLLLRETLGGWVYSGIFSALTGSPANVLLGSDAALSTTPNQRPQVTGSWRLPSNRSLQAKLTEFFNAAAFSSPATGTYGNASRNLIIGPGQINNSMGVSKGFALPWLREGARLDFRCDAFGIFNTPNMGQLSASGLTYGSGLGHDYSTYGERTLQLSLHLGF
jgi:hypothetical protein